MVVDPNFLWLVMSRDSLDYGILGAFGRSRLIIVREIYGMASSLSSLFFFLSSRFVVSLSLPTFVRVHTCARSCYDAWQTRRIAANEFITATGIASLETLFTANSVIILFSQ